MDQEGVLCNEVKTVRDFTYLGDSVSAGGECETAFTDLGGFSLGVAVCY